MTEPAIQELLKKGVAAAKAARQKETPPARVEARRRQARSLLARVLKQDQHNVPAWLWLSTVVDRPEEQAACFKNVLAVDPDNRHARTGLARLEQGATAPPQISRLQKRSTAPVAQPTAAKKTRPAGPGCPFCGQAISSTATTCPQCDLPLVMACPACGQAVEVEHSRCDHCGEPMGPYETPERYFAGLGQRYLKENRPKEAVTAWQMVEKLNSDFPGLHLRLGQAHLGQERPDRAMASLERALAQNPDDPEIHFTLAEMMRRRAERAKAFDYYETVLRLDPKHGLAWLRVAGIYEQVGANKEARQAYRQAVKLLPAEAEESLQARAGLAQVEPKLPEAMATGWPELIRQVTGPILIIVMTVLFDSGLRPWWIPLSGWLALILAFAGAFLFVSGASLPRNPLMRLVVGQQGLPAGEPKFVVAAVGLIFWLVAMGLVLWPLNQSYPDIPDLP